MVLGTMFKDNLGNLCSNMDILFLDWMSFYFLNLRTISLILQYEILEKLVTCI